MSSSVGDAVTNLTNSSTPMVFLTSVSAEVSRACACASTSSASETDPVDFVGGDSGRAIGAGVGFFGGAGGELEAGHEFFDRFSFIAADDLPVFQTVLARTMLKPGVSGGG